MRKKQLKVAGAALLLSGLSVGNVQATPHVVSSSVDAIQQDQSCTGVVYDQNGEAIIGASVVVKGTVNGTITGIDGDFTIPNVKKGDVIIISFVGYSNQEIVWNGSPLKVVLKEDTETLEEVVVVGYGMQRKSSITGSIASVKADKLKSVTTPNVGNMLQGKVAGVVVTPVSGRPGEGVSIRVRGTGSLRGNTEPLWVIDGVVGGNMAELNPNDIESISILKDGSATALYGSRGANGVVQVTTKRALSGGSSFDASIKYGVAELQKGNLEMMNGAEYYDYLVTAFTNAGTLQDQHWLQPYLKERNFDWWDFATQKALTQNYNIGYKYGNDKIRSYISADYYTEEGAIKGFDYDRFTLRSNTDYMVNDRLTLKAKISASYKETMNQEYGLSHTSYTPWDTPYNSKGEIKKGTEGRPNKNDAPTANPDDYWYSDGSSNWLYNNQLNWGKTRTNAMDIGAGFEYKIFDCLTFVSNNKVGFNNYTSENYQDPKAVGQESLQGTIQNSSSNTRTIYTSQLLRFLKTFNDVHEISAYLGYDYDEYRYSDMSGQASQMFQGNEILSGGVANPKVGGTKTEKKNAAYYFNGNYSYDGKYLFQVMFRMDGSSQFGSNKRWAPFWSIGGGWSAHKEKFMENLPWINELKPRISYGISGNLPDGPYEWATVLSSTTQYGSKVALYSNYLGNPDLSWEETATLDFGIDFRFFDRLNIVFDYYHKNVKNLIYLRHLPAVTGYNRQTANNGKMENEGFEVTITPEIIKTKDWYWDISFNLGYNRNEITYLPDGDELTSQATAVGYPYRNWYLREWAGVDPMNGKPLWFKVDKDGNKTVTGNYNEATRVLLDKVPVPKFNGGISTNLTWKGFSLNANFTFATGATIYNGQRAGALDRDCGRNSQPPMCLKDGWSRWEKPGDIATHPQLIDGGNNGADRESTRYLENGDYFKLKSLSLAYSMPKRWLEPLGIKSANLSVGGENLFTITSFSGQDPEILFSSNFNGSASSFGYPTVRRFTVGLNVQF